MMKDLISIVLPVYNGERFLRQSIESIIAQTYRNWELLIVDDGSTDSSAAIAREYEAIDGRIHYHKNPQNIRLPRTLNRGFSLAQGNYLTWTSDDNYFYPTALETMLDALQENEREFTFASCDIVDETGKIVEYITVNKNSAKSIVGSNCVGACFMYSRKVYESVGDYDPEMILVEDFDYWQRICAKFPPVCIPETLYAYRWHDGALTSTMRKDIFNKNLEACLLKNRVAFGRLDAQANYYYYSGLHRCRVNLGEQKNPYTFKYKLYFAVFFLLYRIPNKLRRILAGRNQN